MKILITGGCGFVGSNLAIYFKNNRIGTQINSLDNLSRKGSLLNLARLKKNKIKNFKVDIANSKLIRKLPKYDLIIDCCAEAAVEASKKEIDKVFYTNLVGTFNILKKCTKDKSNIIFLSSSRVYSIQKLLKLKKNKFLINEQFDTSGAKSIYGFCKYSSEHLIKEFSGCSDNNLGVTNKTELLKTLNNNIQSCKDVDFKLLGMSLAGINFLFTPACM